MVGRAAVRRRIVAALVLASLLAIVVVDAAGRTPSNTEPTDLVGSRCYACHATGGGQFGPPLQAEYVVLPPANVSLPVGESAVYPVVVFNTWVAEVFDIEGVLDLSKAPSLGFASDQEPIHQTDTVALPAPSVISERSHRFTVEVPGGITDLRIRATPTTAGAPLAPQIVLRVWPSSLDPDRDEPTEIDRAGSGGAEAFHIEGGPNIAARGFGTWTVDIVQPALDGAAALLAQNVDWAFDAWSNVTGEVRQFTATDEVLDGQDEEASREATLTWDLVALQSPDDDEALLLTVNATLYYDHKGASSGGIDAWRYTRSRSVSALGSGDAGRPVVDLGDDGPPPLPPSDDALPWDRIGEIVGYVSSFLFIASMLTGGVFGKGNRRAMNKVFKTARRRIAFHNFVSYLLTFFALVHTVLFLIEPGFPWTLGILWGSGALLAMFLLGVTGALQVPMIRRWSFGTWRWWHLGLALAALVLIAAHMLLDGANFTEVAEAVGWKDPFQ